MNRDYNRRLKLLLLPYAAGISLLFIVPALMSFALAFFRYDGLSAPRFSGFLNFILTGTDALFSLSIANSLALVLLPVPLRVAGAFLAARLARGGGLRHVLRVAAFLPSAIPASAFALAWLWILNPLYGPLNRLLGSLSLSTPGWLADVGWARPGLALAVLWLIGEGFLVCLAALHDVPRDLEDAAAVDGAGSWGNMRYILLPLLAPVLLLLMVRDAILLLQESFTLTWLLTGGGPYYATYTLPQFIYEAAFDRLDFGVASAALWALYVVTGLLLILVYLIARQWQIGLGEEEFLL